jgi:hypothetical protein
MDLEAAAADFGGSHVHLSEPADGTARLIVMRHLGGDAGSDRQQRLGAVELPNPARSVYAWNQHSLGRVQVKTDDVGQLAGRLRVGTELDRLDSAGLPYLPQIRCTAAKLTPICLPHCRTLQ